MKKIYAAFLFTLLPALTALSQTDCSGGRYFDPIFAATDNELNVTYGSNTNINAEQQSLEMDIYMPSGDVVTDRPVLLLAHGGSFLTGDKTDLTALCEIYARMGYVAITMEYRLGVEFDFVNMEKVFLEAVYRAVQDQKAAIRFLRKTVAADGNPYGINPNIIIVGGVSAGAILSLHTAYLDTPAKIPAMINQTTWGDMEGTSGNPGYSSIPQAVINLCGALGDSSWLEAMDQPFVSVHSMDDDVVPYGTDMVNPGIPVMVVDGSSTIHTRAMNVGVENPFLSFATGGHCGFLTDPVQLDTTNKFVKAFLHDQICLKALFNEAHPQQVMFSAYPNPSTDGFYIDIPGNDQSWNASVTNMLGETVWSGNVSKDEKLVYIATSGFAKGMYTVNLTGAGIQTSRKIMVE